MMSREEVHIRQHRDRLLALAEATHNIHKPMNVKRPRSGAAAAVTASAAATPAKTPMRIGSKSGPKLSIQDFVRNDPGYTPNIEHLVFPDRNKSSPVKSASTDGGSGKTRSRLAEMFALSRHLQQRSADRESKQQQQPRKPTVNRSVDSSVGAGGGGGGHQPGGAAAPIVGTAAASGGRRAEPPLRRWATEEPVHAATATATVGKPANATSRLSPSAEADRADMTTARGPNVSILHLRSTSEPWETSPTSAYAPSGVGSGSSRSYSSARGIAALSKHQSLGAQPGNGQARKKDDGPFYTGSRINSQELYVNNSGMCSRELSPVRWCDQEVDGVYLGRSGWVQVQQRSLDENRRGGYAGAAATGSLPQSRRPGIKLADYHCNSEPAGKCPPEMNRSLDVHIERPAYLPLNTTRDRHDYGGGGTPSPSRPIPESFSPPPITPIISPPPAFQDRIKSRTRGAGPIDAAFRVHQYAKAPFLPRSDAIVDSDVISPPSSPPPPPINWTTLPETRNVSVARRTRLTPSPASSARSFARQHSRMPQTKSLEEATPSTTDRRSQFVQRYKDSSSSSSSSLGFRSLDSCVSRPVMPRLAEHAGSVDAYEDADEEDNNSSSLNLSIVSSSIALNSSPDSVVDRSKTSPSGRPTRHRPQSRRSPASSDANKQATSPSSPSSSSSSSSGGFPVRSPSGSLTAAFRRSAPSRQNAPMRTVAQDDQQRVRRSRSLQLPEKRSPASSAAYRVSPQQQQPPSLPPDAHRVVVKLAAERARRQQAQSRSANDEIDEDVLREAEVVTEFLYGSRSRAAAKALLLHRYHERREDAPDKPTKITTSNGYNVYFVGNGKPPPAQQQQQRQKTLQRGATTPNLQSFTPSPTSESKNPCNSSTCDFWPHCAQRDSLNHQAQNVYAKVSPSYSTHQRSPQQEPRRAGDSTPEPLKKRHAARASPDGMNVSYRRPTTPSDRQDSGDLAAIGPRRAQPKPGEFDAGADRKTSPVNPKGVGRSPSALGNSSCSSSSSDVWITTSDRTVTKSPRNAKSSGASTPLDDHTIASSSTKSDHRPREMILTRPGSAPVNVEEERSRAAGDAQKRSMSLPKSFLSGRNKQGGQFLCKRQGSESVRGPSTSPHHRPPTPEIAHTAPVTPLHDPVTDRRRSPGFTKAARRAKASSTPHLLDQPEWDTDRRWNDKNTDIASQKDVGPTALLPNPRLQPDVPKDPIFHSQRNISSGTAESVLQKFRKTFSLRFQKKGSKESCGSGDYGDCYVDPSEEDSPQHHATSRLQDVIKETETTEQKHRFGPLVWRSSKERKKNSKASRSAKCNSGDSGIQIEMVSGFSGSGLAGDSSESHDTDQQGDETDSPPAVRRRANVSGKASRPHSDLINQILIDKFKADLQSRAHRHQHVRRTHSDLGGQRIFQWEARSSYRRMMSTPSPLKSRPQQRLSPRRKPPDAPGNVQLRGPSKRGKTQLRRSLSQPIDIDKLSPLMRTKTVGLRAGNNVFSEDEHDGRLGTSDDETMSDSESSVASLSERKKSLESAMDEEMVILAEAVFDHVAIEAEELAFRAGDVIEVLETVNRDWWWGSTAGRTGWFPAAFVRLRVSQEDTVEDCLAAMASGKTTSKTLRRRTSISLLSNEQVRTSVVRELVHTERDFVKVLTDVVEGYIAECRRRKDMFSAEQIQTIFINLEDMLKFQSQFLKDLETCIDWDAPHKSCVGNCFLTHRAGFRMYSDYCNHHPMATATLQELYQFNNYSKFFEACRLMRGLIEIPLDGYLLTPVQRICKYPLQLAELLKYTRADHPDYDEIKEALGAMRDVAVLINERKRRMESLEKLAAWQQRVEGWEGEDLIEVSSQLIHQGEAVRVTSGMWTNNVTLFLFDRQIIYCKKDILKRNTYVYKGRICLDTSEIIDIPDGKDPQLGANVRHGLKVYSCVRDKWLLFCCRSAHDKQKWLDAFAQERRSVAQDRDEGLEFPPAARKLARLAARCQRRPPSKPRGGKNYKRDSAYMGSTLQINTHGSNSLGRMMGTWFTFGSNKKSRHYDRSS